MGTEYQAPYMALASALAAEGRPSEALVEVFKQARTKRPNPGGSLPVIEVNAHSFAGDSSRRHGPRSSSSAPWSPARERTSTRSPRR